MDRIQHFVSSFILQLPKSAAGVSGALEAGLMSKEDMVNKRIGLFFWRIMNKKKDKVL